MQNQQVKISRFRDSIRMRPAMYLGNSGRKFRNLLDYFLESIIKSASQKITAEFTLLSENRLQIRIDQADGQRFIQGIIDFQEITYGELEPNGYFINELGINLLISLSSHISISIGDGNRNLHLNGVDGEFNIDITVSETKNNHIFIDFTLDPEFFDGGQFRYSEMNILFQKWAYLYPLKVVSRDKNSVEVQTILFDYPRGIFEAMDLEISKWYYGEVLLRTEIEVSISDYTYKIGICFSSCFTDPGLVRTYANHKEMVSGGSFHDGILSGLTNSIRKCAGIYGLRMQISKRRMQEQLLVFGAVKGPEMIYSGSVQCALKMPWLKKQVLEIVSDHMDTFFASNHETAERLLQQLEPGCFLPVFLREKH